MTPPDEILDLRNKIIEEFSPHWELNDKAHRIEHFLAVERCGNYINDTLRLGFDPKLILLVAFFHDLFAWSRHNHHLMSGDWVLQTDHEIFESLTSEERALVSAGCREHRASNKEPFTHAFAQLMSSADRGFPDPTLKGMVQRAIEYRLYRGANTEEARKGAVRHVKEKYGSRGYAVYPSFYEAVFKAELKQQRDLVDLL